MPDDEEFESFEDEEAPESLQRKWDNEEFQDELTDKKFGPCPKCSKMIEAKSFFCLYCGERIFSNSGFLGNLGHWIVSGWLGWILGLVILSFLMVMVF